MIRGLFLQYLYQSSDPQLEDHLIDRLSFRRFRETLAGVGLFEETTDQLDAKGLLLQGTVVDATIINSVKRPQRPYWRGSG